MPFPPPVRLRPRPPAPCLARLLRLRRATCPRTAPPAVPRPQPLLSQCRAYARRRTKASVADLPQGALPLPPLEDEPPPSAPRLPTVLAQARANMDTYTSCILLTRVGGFYELYFEHADVFGPRLGLKVAKKRTNSGHVSMAGFPFYGLERVLKVLVQEEGRYVAVAEEFPASDAVTGAEGGLMWERRVARVVTPGTLIDERFLEAGEWHFLLAISPPEPGSDEVGLAWLDLGTGDFFTQISARGALRGDINRIGPREIVLGVGDAEDLKLAETTAGCTLTIHDLLAGEKPDWASMLESAIPEATMAAMTASERAAGDRLLGYVKTRLPGMALKLQPPIRRSNADVMAIDASSMRGLEIKTTLRDNTARGSLLHTINRTVTRSGARLLATRLVNPAADVQVIDGRLDIVDTFLADEKLRDEVVKTLKKTSDSQRILQKLSLGRGDADDLLALAKTVQCTDSLAALLARKPARPRRTPAGGRARSPSLQALVQGLQTPGGLAKRIECAIDEEGLWQQHRKEESETAEQVEEMAEASGVPLGERKRSKRMLKPAEAERLEAWVMQKTASAVLGRLHEDLDGLMREKDRLEEDLRTRLNAQTLTLRWTPGLGHICHVRSKDTSALNSALPDARSVSSSRSTHSFHIPAWTSLGALIDSARLRIRAEEANVFSSLRTHVITHLPVLRTNAGTLDVLDVSTSLANLASELGWTRPKLTHSTATSIIGGRHPTVEAGLREQGKSFVPNDLHLSPFERLWVLTGPNMAGKSTFLRQNALITILAQMGSFVPASYAEMGVVDAVFSRVGSADNLFRHQSTFMVEMLETAEILRRATGRSLVVMDEVGRGTTPRDGVAVAFAVVKALVEQNGCRGVFATHFHRLVDMLDGEEGAQEGAEGNDGKPKVGRPANRVEGVAAYCTDLLMDEDGAWAYGYKLRRGVNRESHALKVAKMAGIPNGVVQEAERIVEELRQLEEAEAEAAKERQGGDTTG